MEHTVNIMSVKTANKDGKKYLSKQGDQAWRVSLKINDDWYACMIYEEEFVPKKGAKINIELEENDGWKNWKYKLLTKKEQIAGAITQEDLPPTARTDWKPEVNLNGRGAAWNNAFYWCLKNYPGEPLEDFLVHVKRIAAIIAPYQEEFVQDK